MLKNKINKLSELLSKKLKLDINYFLKAGFYTNINVAVNIVLGIILTFSIARFFPQTEVGRYYFILAVLGVFGIFSLNGFTTATTSSFLKGYFSSYKRTLKIQFISSLIGSVLLIILAIYSYFYYKGIWYYFLLLAFVLPFNIFKLYSRYLYVNDQFEKITFLSITKQFLYYTPTIILVFLRFNLLIILIVFFSTQFLFDFMASWHYHCKIKRIENIKKEDGELVSSGFKFSLINLAPAIAQNLDKILLPLFLNLPELAIFGVALIIPQNLFGLISKFSIPLFFKKTSQISEKTLKKKLRKNLIILLTAIILLTSFAWFLTPFFIRYILTDAYLESIKYAQFLVLFIIFVSFSSLFERLYESQRKIKKLFKVETFPYLLQIILTLVLIPLFGIWGAVVSRGATHLIRMLLCLRIKT